MCLAKNMSLIQSAISVKFMIIWMRKNGKDGSHHQVIIFATAITNKIKYFFIHFLCLKSNGKSIFVTTIKHLVEVKGSLQILPMKTLSIFQVMMMTNHRKIWFCCLTTQTNLLRTLVDMYTALPYIRHHPPQMLLKSWPLIKIVVGIK